MGGGGGWACGCVAETPLLFVSHISPAKCLRYQSAPAVAVFWARGRLRLQLPPALQHLIFKPKSTLYPVATD